MNLKELFTWRRPWSIPINRIDQAILGYESDEEIRINYYGTSNFHLRGWKPYKLAHVPLSMVEQNLIRFDMQFWWPLRWPSLRSFGSQTNRRQKPKHPNFRYKWRATSQNWCESTVLIKMELACGIILWTPIQFHCRLILGPVPVFQSICSLQRVWHLDGRQRAVVR